METIGQLTSGLSHDSANLLQAMLSALEVLQRRTLDSVQRRIATETAEAGQRAMRIVRQLFAAARRETPISERLSPSEAALGMRDLLQGSVGPSVRVTMEIAPDIWRVFLGPGGIEMAPLNLAVNARDATPSGGRLLIATRNLPVAAGDVLRPGVAPGGYVTLTIRDNGTGMSFPGAGAAVPAHLHDRTPRQGYWSRPRHGERLRAVFGRVSPAGECAGRGRSRHGRTGGDRQRRPAPGRPAASHPQRTS